MKTAKNSHLQGKQSLMIIKEKFAQVELLIELN